MRKIIISLVLFVAIAFFKPVCSFASFTYIKDQQNPLHHNFYILQHTISHDGSGFHMWFTGRDSGNLKILYSDSGDGVNWSPSVIARNFILN